MEKIKKFIKEYKNLIKLFFKLMLRAMAILAAGIILFVIISLLMGKFDEIIVSWDLRYDSPGIIALIVAFFAISIISLGVAIVLGCHKYRRPGGKGMFHVTYPKGNSFKALSHVLNLSGEENVSRKGERNEAT